MARWNSVFVFGLILSGSVQAVCYLFEFIHPNQVSRQKNRKKKRGRSIWQRRAISQRRRLHKNLVTRCRRRAGNSPPRLIESRFRSPRDRNARQRCHRRKASGAKGYWEFYRDSKIDRYDDFPMTTLNVDESDRWQQYLGEFIVEMENHVANAKK